MVDEDNESLKGLYMEEIPLKLNLYILYKVFGRLKLAQGGL